MSKQNASVLYATVLIKKYGGWSDKPLDEKKVSKMTTSGQIAKEVLTQEQYEQWLLDEGSTWNDDAPGKDEYNQLLKRRGMA